MTNSIGNTEETNSDKPEAEGDQTRPSENRRVFYVVGIGLFAACLLYGDGMITPAISVLSAVECRGCHFVFSSPGKPGDQDRRQACDDSVNVITGPVHGKGKGHRAPTIAGGDIHKPYVGLRLHGHDASCPCLHRDSMDTHITKYYNIFRFCLFLNWPLV